MKNNLSKIKILIVDDNADHRLLYRSYLENDPNYPSEVVEAENIKLALELWYSENPDLVLLDYRLPDGNGLDFLKSISNEQLSKLPVIMLTAQGDQKIAISAMKLGACDFLSKIEINRFSLSLAVSQVWEKIILNRQILRSQQKEKIINDIALRIRQYLNIEELLSAIVGEVKNFLEADRVIIYQFDDNFYGTVVAEAVNSPWRVSLDQQIIDTCFTENKGRAFHSDEIFVINDIYQAHLTPCHLQLLEQFQVKANLVVPIVLKDQTQTNLWGLLIAHQCSATRQWETIEIKLLQRLSIQLAIALQQANLYHSLEQKVIERTIELENSKERNQKQLELINQQLEHKVQQRTEQLLKINSLQQAILNSSIYSIISCDLNGIIQSFNQGAERMLGYHASEVIGKYTPEMIHDPQEIIKQAQNLSRELGKEINPNLEVFFIKSRCNLPNEQEWTYIRKDGSRFPVFLSITSIKNEQEEIIGFLGIAQDISDRKASEVALQDSQARWQFALEGTGDGIWDWNLQTQEVFYSSNWKAMLGYNDDEITNHVKEWESRIHPDDHDRCFENTQKYISGEIPVYEIEHRLLTQDGSYKWILSRGKLVEWTEDGQPLRLIGTHTDISDRKKAEREWQKLTQRLNIALESGQIGCWDWDIQQNIITWDQRMFQLYGLTPPNEGQMNQISYELWAKTVDPDDFPQIETQLYQAVLGEAKYDPEFRVILPDGKIRYIKAYGEVVVDAQGNPQRMIGVNIDISDRTIAELEREKLTQRLNMALESAGIGCWEWNIKHNIVTWDQRMFQLYGLKPTTTWHISYEEWQKTVHPDDLMITETLLTKTINAGIPFQQELRIFHPDGSMHYLQTYAMMLRDQQDQPQRMIGVNIDISDRKQAEVLLQQTNRELISATRLKDEFLANMSHELRTPLNAILGMTEALLDRIVGEINPKQHQFLETINSSANHLLSLINDILDVAKIESGQIELERQALDVVPLCQSSLTFIKQPAQKKRIQLQTKIPSKLPPLEGDERRLRQVLINLLNNAVKFTPEGGQITLEVSQILETDGLNYLRFAVIDTGIGITPDNIKKLFKPFIQIDSALNRQYEGTGLGLALVKNIVELHGGKVGVTSSKGEGSSFMIDLPYLALKQEVTSNNLNQTNSDQIVEEELIIKKPSLILLAEDNEANLITLSSYLTAKGYHLIVAHNGQEALTMLQSHHPDLIIMDIQMPGMDGLEATKYIRNQLKLTQLPIIALTALAMEGDQEKCLEAGANQYLSKPVKLKNLVDIIENLLKNR